jgi:deferrochelatase/peroxidase EfeB
MPPALNLSDIQGNIVRGYGYRHARHFALAINDAKLARAFIAALVCGDEALSPQISTEETWRPKHRPPYRLNLGFTWAGLGELEVPKETLNAFPEAFQQGPATRAEKPDSDFPESVGLGDQEESAPQHWILGGTKNPGVHMLLSLYTDDHEKGPLEGLTTRLRKLFTDANLTEILAYDADALPERRVHFDYRDGIAQPHIEGAPGRECPDMQPEAKTGDFLLGCDYENLYGGNYLGEIPPELGDNASYAAFRILEQDVPAFEKLLTDWAKLYKLEGGAEFVAAKLMGRWRNGVPLTLSPEHPDPPVKEEKLNEFDYAPAPGHNTYYDDLHGTRCPIGAHIRRLNPRSAVVAGQPHGRRLIRRGMPYGPPYEGNDDGAKRGLVGIFVCGDLEMQYEFILRVWANMDLAAHGLQGTRDPIIGAQPNGGSFILRTEGGRDPIVMTGLPRLVETRGSVYLFMPGINGLKHLGAPAAGKVAKS